MFTWSSTKSLFCEFKGMNADYKIDSVRTSLNETV